MPSVPFEKVCPDASPDAINLLKRFLVYPSNSRISANEALLDEYFFLDPLPAHRTELLIPNRKCSNEKKLDVDAPLNIQQFLK